MCQSNKPGIFARLVTCAQCKRASRGSKASPQRGQPKPKAKRAAVDSASLILPEPLPEAEHPTEPRITRNQPSTELVCLVERERAAGR